MIIDTDDPNMQDVLRTLSDTEIIRVRDALNQIRHQRKTECTVPPAPEVDFLVDVWNKISCRKLTLDNGVAYTERGVRVDFYKGPKLAYFSLSYQGITIKHHGRPKLWPLTQLGIEYSMEYVEGLGQK